MFETDAEYLKVKEEMYKKRGLKIVEPSLLLKEKYRELKMIFLVTAFASIVYSFVVGLVIGGA